MTEQRTISVRFQPQQWIDDNATDCAPESVFDVTERVLTMPLERIHTLRDKSDRVDDLCPSDVTGHDGPYYVIAENPICEFFDVSDIADVTAAQVALALAEFSLRGTGI
jgi:hypothetical protein